MTLIAIASIPGLLTGGIMYFLVVGHMENEMSRLHARQIEARAKNIDDQLSYLELGLSHWAFEPRFGEPLRSLDFVYEFQQTRELVTTLLMLQGSHPLIDSVRLYLDRPRPILFDINYSELHDSALIAAYRKYISDGNDMYWTDRIPGEPGGKGLAVLHKIPGDSTEPFGALIVALNGERMVNLLKTLTPYDAGITLLTDAAGVTLAEAASAEDMDEHGSLSSDIKAEVAGRNTDAGSFIFKHADTTYSVSYGKLSRMQSEWTYISASPMTEITAPVRLVSQILLGISAGGLVLALISSWFASRRIYSPVERMINLLGSRKAGLSCEGADEFELLEAEWYSLSSESSLVSEKLREQLPQIRGSFLHQLLQGQLYFYSEQDLRERMNQLGWEVDGRQQLLLTVYLSGHGRMAERFQSDDKGLVTFAAANIIEEHAEGRFEQFHVLNFHNLSAALLVLGPQEEDVKGSLLLWADELADIIDRIIKMNVILIASRPVQRIEELPNVFMEMEQAALLRSLEDRNQLLDMEHIRRGQHEPFMYPFVVERELLQSVRMGRREAAVTLLDKFMDEIMKGKRTEYSVKQAMLQLLASIQHMLLQSGSPPYKFFGSRNMFESLSAIREPGQMRNWMLDEVLEPLIRVMQEHGESSLQRIVEQTVSYIDQHYMTEVSLESCAELAGVSPYTLSKAFKQTTGVNFIDYLTSVRMEAAKRLLRDTDQKVQQIAAQVGYQHSYFNRIFKKVEGVTPGKYRDSFTD